MHNVEDFSVCVPYDIMTIYLSSSWKKEYITPAICYLPIVLSNTTRYNFIPFNVWWPDWKMFAKLWFCRTGHPHGIAPMRIYICSNQTVVVRNSDLPIYMHFKSLGERMHIEIIWKYFVTTCIWQEQRYWLVSFIVDSVWPKIPTLLLISQKRL